MQPVTMKFTLAFLLLGVLIESVTACNLASCALTGSVIGIDGCKTYGDYITCLNTEKDTCTSPTDVSVKGFIESAITTNTALKAVLPCGGTSLTSISSMALILSVVITLMRVHL